METRRKIALRMEGISKRFQNTVALHDVTFQVYAGTVHALIGENGAGKSTLMKILSGVHKADSGKIYIQEKEVTIRDTHEAIDMGISMVYQELNYVPDMTIGENLFLGREPKNKLGCVNRKEMYRQAARLFEDFDLHFNPGAEMRTLSIANMQMVEIVKALSKNTKIIVMDEPTSSLTEKETSILFKFIRKLTADGITVIYISHRMEELDEIADDVTVLRDGEVVCSAPKSEMSSDRIVTNMVGRSISTYYPRTDHPLGDTVLKVEHLTKEGLFRDVSLEVRAGEILGVSGLVGAGRTEVFSAVFGMIQADSGSVFVDGKQINIRRVRDGVNAGLAYVPEDRKRLGIVACRSILENITLPRLSEYRAWSLELKREKSEVGEIMRSFAVKAASADAPASSLSGGNQQKVVLCRWLLRKPKVLILDEPTRGIDVGSKYEIYKYIDELAKQGIAIVMISSELPEILGMSDRAMVMCEGRVTAFYPREEMSSEKILKSAMERI